MEACLFFMLEIFLTFFQHFGISKHESITKNKEMLYEKAKKAKELLSSRK